MKTVSNQSSQKKPRIAVPIGDPAGVGPEIAAKACALEKVQAAADVILIGDRKVMENAIRILHEILDNFHGPDAPGQQPHIYFSGYGAYSLLLDEDDSGSLVLSAVRR